MTMARQSARFYATGRRKTATARVFIRLGTGDVWCTEVAARAPGWADRQMCEFAQVATVAQLRRMIRDEHFDHDPDQPPAPEPKRDRASLSIAWDEHSRLQIHGGLDADQGLVFEAAAGEIRDAMLRDGAGDVSWGEVLAEMARR